MEIKLRKDALTLAQEQIKRMFPNSAEARAERNEIVREQLEKTLPGSPSSGETADQESGGTEAVGASAPAPAEPNVLPPETLEAARRQQVSDQIALLREQAAEEERRRRMPPIPEPVREPRQVVGQSAYEANSQAADLDRALAVVREKAGGFEANRLALSNTKLPGHDAEMLERWAERRHLESLVITEETAQKPDWADPITGRAYYSERGKAKGRKARAASREARRSLGWPSSGAEVEEGIHATDDSTPQITIESSWDEE